MGELEQAIAGLGTNRFRDGLLAYANAIARVDHVALIRFDQASRARIVASATRAGARIRGDGVQRAYEHCFYRSDPNQDAWRGNRSDTGTGFRRLVPRRLSDADYRLHCFDSARLIDRLSVIASAEGFHYCVNLYRCADTGPFADDEAAAFRDDAALLAALSVKHDRLTCRGPAAPDRAARLSDLMAKLSAIQRRLTRRELEVGARIVIGMGSEAIALELGLSQNSVATYRKRAYDKLGIACQNELFALCYFG